MKILLHICCAPCAIYPLGVLRNEGHEVVGLFYNPNIQPYTEYVRRLETLIAYAEDTAMRLIRFDEYPMEEFLRGVAFREGARCEYCYHMRMEYAARIARKGKFDGFTTTLLYSKFQDHSRLKEMGEAMGKKHHVDFYYHDFREGWKEGIKISKDRKMYRQQYCGCIYSEKERYYKGS
ncbi:MAG: epoxyqueuosine reductase QueH [Deltaproteobacteria bacterium]|nr:epoxyqueuosine reductase QueH [Deltaproteobacteria bacterium]